MSSAMLVRQVAWWLMSTEDSVTHVPTLAVHLASVLFNKLFNTLRCEVIRGFTGHWEYQSPLEHT